MAEKLRIALVGCGGMMGAHVKNGYRKLWDAGYREFDLIACCDVFEESARKMAAGIAEWQGAQPRVYGDFQMLLADRDAFDAAVAVVPHNEHHRVAVPLLAAKKHLLLEKPLALTLRAGRLILDAAAANKVVFAIAENYRRSPSHRTINWVVQSGRIGQPRHIHWLDVKERLWHWGWRDDFEKAGGGWTLDGGVHYADLMLYDLGPVARVAAISRNYNSKRYRDPAKLEGEIQASIEDTTMALLEFENGATGVWSECISAAGESVGRQIIHGDKGSIDFSAGLRLRGQEAPTKIEALKEEFLGQLSEGEKARYFPFGIEDGLAQEIHEFIQACLHGGSVETDGRVGYQAQAICMAVYESASLGGQPVELRRVEALEIENYQRALNRSVGL